MIAVLRRLRGLFQRYCAQHLLVVGSGMVLETAGRTLGVVERVARRGNRLEVEGWVHGDRVELLCGDETVSAATQPASSPDGAGRRFNLDLPAARGTLRLSVLRPLGGSSPRDFALPVIMPLAVSWARLRLLPGFSFRLCKALPLVLAWTRSKDPALRPRIRAALGLYVLPAARPLDQGLFELPSKEVPELVPFTCILPVYNAFALLPEVIDRVEAHTDLPCHLVIVEDASTDPAVRPFLRRWVASLAPGAKLSAEMIENERNLGFVGSVNRGLELALARGGPVVLLNSDALVPAGWAGRLLAPILRDPSVASTTPLSNDAEIFSVPVICSRMPLVPGQADSLDWLARSFAPPEPAPDAPTGVGFCMGMSGRWLAKQPQFDTAFGRGYGEEVDWCQKIRALGGRHVGTVNLFVEHRGGTSFGSEEKKRLVALNGERISRRYPDYDIEVQDYIRADPIVTARLALAIGWLAQQAGVSRVPVYLSHALGGGVEHYMDNRLGEDVSTLGGAVVLRIGTASRWRLEVWSAAGSVMGQTDDFALIKTLMRPLQRRRLVYVCAVGDSDPASFPDRLLDLAGEVDTELEVMFHDFYPLSPSANLLDADGWYRGVPAADCSDAAHNRPVSLKEWRIGWGKVIARADRIVTFSRDSSDRVLEVWPTVSERLVVVPHLLPQPMPRVTPRAGPRPVLAVLGHLNIQKGHAVVMEMARLMGAGSRDLDLVLIGDLDPACARPPGVTVHGPYARRDIELLARRYRVTAWLVPAVWPETFSYTTHEALATGLPVICLDLGAQAEAVRAAGGHVVAHHAAPEKQARAVLDTARAVIQAQGA